MSRRRSTASTALRILSDLRLIPRKSRRGTKRGRGGFGAGMGGSRRMRSSVPFWHRHRTPLALGSVLVLLGAINLYVLYYRSNTSVPALIDLASSGRRAALSPRLVGPPGTPPVPTRPLRRTRTVPVLPDYPRVVEVRFKMGDNLAAVLRAHAITGVAADELQASLRPLLDPGGLGPRQTLTLFHDADDALAAVDYRASDTSGYHLERVATGSAERFVMTRLDQPQTRQAEVVTLTLAHDGDLNGAVAGAGEQPALAARLAEIFACDLGLYTDTRAGDRLRVLIEKVAIGGSFYRYGRLLAAEFLPRPRAAGDTPRVARLRAFLGPGAATSLENAGAASGSAVHYYNEGGDSMARATCRAPLLYARAPDGAAARLSSASTRPTPHSDRTRLAVDYPAPAGTPVVAAGAGRVLFRGARSPGGLTVVIQHPGGVETTYQNLSRWARGLHPGQPVRLRQLIGFVAGAAPASPRAGHSAHPDHTPPTVAPHLHFAVRTGTKFVDATRYRAPREPSVPATARASFNEQVAAWLDRLAQPPNPSDRPADTVADAAPTSPAGAPR